MDVCLVFAPEDLLPGGEFATWSKLTSSSGFSSANTPGGKYESALIGVKKDYPLTLAGGFGFVRN